MSMISPVVAQTVFEAVTVDKTTRTQRLDKVLFNVQSNQYVGNKLTLSNNIAVTGISTNPSLGSSSNQNLMTETGIKTAISNSTTDVISALSPRISDMEGWTNYWRTNDSLWATNPARADVNMADYDISGADSIAARYYTSSLNEPFDMVMLASNTASLGSFIMRDLFSNYWLSVTNASRKTIIAPGINSASATNDLEINSGTNVLDLTGGIVRIRGIDSTSLVTNRGATNVVLSGVYGTFDESTKIITLPSNLTNIFRIFSNDLDTITNHIWNLSNHINIVTQGLYDTISYSEGTTNSASSTGTTIYITFNTNFLTDLSEGITNYFRNWGSITNTPISLSGYGITDLVLYASDTNGWDVRDHGALTQNLYQTISFSEGTTNSASATGATIYISFKTDYAGNPDEATTNYFRNWDNFTNTPTTLVGYGITDAGTVTGATATLPVGNYYSWIRGDSVFGAGVITTKYVYANSGKYDPDFTITDSDLYMKFALTRPMYSDGLEYDGTNFPDYSVAYLGYPKLALTSNMVSSSVSADTPININTFNRAFDNNFTSITSTGTHNSDIHSYLIDLGAQYSGFTVLTAVFKSASEGRYVLGGVRESLMSGGIVQGLPDYGSAVDSRIGISTVTQTIVKAFAGQYVGLTINDGGGASSYWIKDWSVFGVTNGFKAFTGVP